MTLTKSKPSVLVIGAGAMGIVTGYHLALAGASVTFLVRPHRLDALVRPQVLYCYDDQTLRTYTGYECVSDPARIERGRYDYVVITLDGTALRSVEGANLARAIGDAVRDTNTKIVIGTVGFGLRPWFLTASGLAAGQVTNGVLSIMVHPVAGVQLPLHPPTDPALLAQADLAYVHSGDAGFIVDDSVPAIARDFADLYSASGASRCTVMDAREFAPAILALFPFFTASDMRGWPGAETLAQDTELWTLTTEAVREIQGLEVFGEAGRKAKARTTPATLAAMWRDREAATLPMDLPAFNRFHHGNKVHQQDRQLLLDCVLEGKAQGQTMTALEELVARADAHRPTVTE